MTKIHFHKGDLPDHIKFSGAIAVDTETLGLSLHRDRLCLIQISAGDGQAHLVQFDGNFHCPNLKAILADQTIEKIFHYGRFDIGMIQKWLGVACAPVFCTKIASKLARTYTDRHGLKDVVREICEVDLSKQQQSSDWSSPTLTDAQKAYAANDVLYLHQVKAGLETMLKREDRLPIAKACFDFLQTRVALDLLDWESDDIFSHSWR